MYRLKYSIAMFVNKFIKNNLNFLSYFIAAFLGLSLSLYVIPLKLFFGGLPASFNDEDRGQHLLGSMFYLARPWSDGALSIGNVDPGHFVTVGFFDSIPIFSFLIKIWNSIFPYHFYQSIDPFAAISLMLQPVSAVFVIRALGIKGLSSAFFVSLLALLSAVLWNVDFISRETALGGQWLLIFAIGLYFRALSHHKSWSVGLWFVILLPLAFYIHPYIAGMVALVAVTLPLTMLIRRYPLRDVASCFFIMIGSVCLTGLLAFLGGYSGAVGLGFLYGEDPFKFAFLIHKKWHGSLPDGFWLLVIAFFVQRVFFKKTAPHIDWKDFLHRHIGTILLSFGCLFFACAGQIRLGHHVFLRWGTDWIPLHTIFRYSSRFAEVTEYLLFFAFFVYWARQGRVGRWLLSGACVIEVFVSISAIRVEYKEIRYDTLFQLPEHIRQITIVPSAACQPPTARDEFAQLANKEEQIINQVFSQNHDLRINGGLYLARYYPYQLCQLKNLEIPHKLLENAVSKDHLVFLSGPFASSAVTEWQQKGMECVNISGIPYELYLCHAQ